jgi:hypothetical protein
LGLLEVQKAKKEEQGKEKGFISKAVTGSKAIVGFIYP